MICESCGYHGICLVCSDEEEEEWMMANGDLFQPFMIYIEDRWLTLPEKRSPFGGHHLASSK